MVERSAMEQMIFTRTNVVADRFHRRSLSRILDRENSRGGVRMAEWFMVHPWMTFFICIAFAEGLGNITIRRGK